MARRRTIADRNDPGYMQRDMALILEKRDRDARKARCKERTCLMCSKLFSSEGPHNRICEYCKKYRDIFTTGNYMETFSTGHRVGAGGAGNRKGHS